MQNRQIYYLRIKLSYEYRIITGTVFLELEGNTDSGEFEPDELAEKADLSVGYICDLESGRRWGTLETFSKLARALNVNPFELLLPKTLELSASDISFRNTFAAKVNQAIQKNLRETIDNAIFQVMNESVK